MAFSKAVWEVGIQHKPGLFFFFFPFEKGHIRKQMKNTEEFHFKPALLPHCPLPRRRDQWKNPPRFQGCLFLVLWCRPRLELCAALSGGRGRLRLRRCLCARGRFDRVQRFAKPRVFGSLDFVHKGSSLVLQLLRKQNSQN